MIYLFHGLAPTQPQHNCNLNCTWVWHENDFETPPHPDTRHRVINRDFGIGGDFFPHPSVWGGGTLGSGTLGDI